VQDDQAHAVDVHHRQARRHVGEQSGEAAAGQQQGADQQDSGKTTQHHAFGARGLALGREAA
jgi:hypothetical protein